jgi:hypothetical protein
MTYYEALGIVWAPIGQILVALLILSVLIVWLEPPVAWLIRVAKTEIALWQRSKPQPARPCETDRIVLGLFDACEDLQMADHVLARHVTEDEAEDWKIVARKEQAERAALALELGRGADTLNECEAAAIRSWLRPYLKG